MADEKAPPEEEEMLDVDEEEPKPSKPAPAPAGAGLVDRAWAMQRRLESRVAGVGRGRIARVLRMARKPEPEEFRQSAIIVLVGIAVVGGIGFFILLLMEALMRAITPT